MLKSFIFRKQKTRSQLGFTLIEIVIALAIAALLGVSSGAIMSYLVKTGDKADQIMANLQVQYVSFWIGEDVVQAGNITLGNSTVGGDQVVGFPFTLTLVDKGGGNYTVTYSVGQMPAKEKTLGNTLMSLYRAKDGGNVTVAEYLYPLGTNCELNPVGNQTYKLVLNVAAMVDQKEATGRYEINPRAYNPPYP